MSLCSTPIRKFIKLLAEGYFSGEVQPYWTKKMIWKEMVKMIIFALHAGIFMQRAAILAQGGYVLPSIFAGDTQTVKRLN